MKRSIPFLIILFFAGLLAWPGCEILETDQDESVYSVIMTVSDGENEFDLQFGQDTDPNSRRAEAPPPPPEGAFHAWFERSDLNLWSDFRRHTTRDVTWRLQIQPGNHHEITLSWSIESERFPGTLSLHDESGSTLLGLISDGGSFDIEIDSRETLLIQYVVEDIDEQE